jgi:phosphomethylpyrimidine synthase
MDRDIAISKARAELDWEGQFNNCLDPEHARARRKERGPGKADDDVCSMCGKYCAIKITKEYLK